MSEFNRELSQNWRVWPRPSRDSQQAARLERELDQIAGLGPKKRRTVPVKLLVQLLVEAEKHNRGWIKDFEEDTVVIDADLHDVLLAYKQHRHNRAA